MHEYDTVLKSLFTGFENLIFRLLTGAAGGRWLSVELPEVRQMRVDLLFETAEEPARLIAMELQSTNDALLPLRMAEYSLGVYRVYGRFPEQYVLYIGNEKMRMPAELAGPKHVCRYTIFDIRTIDAEPLLKSPYAADNVIAILARYGDRRATIRRILERIAILEEEQRQLALSKLTILAGLRKLGTEIRTEAKRMPILDDIMDHDLLGPAIRQGRQEGLQEGRREGRQEGSVAILRRLIAKRFGAISASDEERLSKLSLPEIEAASLRLLDANTIAELFDR